MTENEVLDFLPVHQSYKAKESTTGDFLRKPEWLKVRLPNTPDFNRVRGVLSRHGLHTICQEARCPNMSECFQDGTATFLILGSICTRNCRYCNVAHGVPAPIDKGEAGRLVFAVKSLSLKYVVITSVTRDDLPDGGAGTFARAIGALRESLPDIRIEVLIPDFQGQVAALEEVIAARPHVINHNIEVSPSLYAQLRPEGNYERSLKILGRVGRAPSLISKSGFMIGFGESTEDIYRLLEDLAGAGCQSVTIGQYLQPTTDHWPVRKYYHPDEFAEIRETALAMGFRHVEAGPLVRSSYQAALSGS
ncbi:MAG TPA: lipoyl synthase [Syntrophus sp. (in: bacteria)]|jgi:lipoic acid synthetase|nr:lipoyl synthase [Syntrophus sp. (in: bacteria)]